MEETVTVPKDLLNNLGLGGLGKAKPMRDDPVKAMRGSIKIKKEWAEELVELDEWE